MAASTFGALPTPGLISFNWENRGPVRTKRDNTDVYSGSILISSATPAADMAVLAGMWREIAIRPIPASSGLGFYADYNGTADPSHPLTLSDGSIVTAVLTKFERRQWQVSDLQICNVEFTRVA